MIPSFIVTGKPYEFMKWLTLIVLPALSSAYFALGNLYGWPNTEQVVGTLAILTTFLGVVLGISVKNYNASDAKYDGVIEMQPSATEPAKWIYTLELNEDVESFVGKSSVTFKIDDASMIESG